MQTVVKIGNSAGIVIPKALRDDLPVGTKVKLSKKGDDLVVSPVKNVAAEDGVDVEFMKMVDGFMEDHKDVLKKLAKR